MRTLLTYHATLINYKIPVILKYIIILALFLTVFTSCGLSQIPIPERSFLSSDSECLVIGRLQVFANGKPIQAKGPGILDSLKLSLSEYVSVQEAIKTRSWKDLSSSNIRIYREDGYFTVKLRPGKYFVLAIGLVANNPVTGGLVWAYPIRGSSSDSCNSRNNEIIVITIQPGHANYIGTIKTILSTNHTRLVSREVSRSHVDASHVRVVYEKVPERMWGIDENQLVNEEEIAKNIFKELYPNHSTFITNLGEISIVP
jgi:hypothetical protein